MRYHDANGKLKKATITLNKNNPQAVNTAQRLLNEKVNAIKEQEKEDRTAYFHKVAYDWLEYARPTVKMATHRNHTTYVKLILKHIQEGTLFHAVTPIHIEKILHTLYYENNLAYTTVKSTLVTIKAIYRYARRHRIITNIQDFEDISIKQKPQSRTDIKKKRDKFLDKSELKEALSQLQVMHPRIALAMEFIAHTGLRCGELLALRVEDYNKESRTINVNGTIVQYSKNGTEAQRGTPKNVYSVRDISLDSRSIQILDTIILENRKSALWSKGKYKEQGYIFTTATGNPINIQYIGHKLRKLSVNNKKITTHVFRHSHISLLAELGVPLKAIMQRVGHNDPNTTLSIYTHVTKAMQEEVISKLEKISL